MTQVTRSEVATGGWYLICNISDRHSTHDHYGILEGRSLPLYTIVAAESFWVWRTDKYEALHSESMSFCQLNLKTRYFKLSDEEVMSHIILEAI